VSAAAGHGSIELIEDRCTSCMICARECPSWCIAIDSHTEPVPDLPPGTRERTHNVLDRFEIDWTLCMYCGICVEECPFDALAWEPEHTAAAPSAVTLRYGIPELSQQQPLKLIPVSHRTGASRQQ
jgi:NADH-quinone oxidoreductase subunit I